MDADGRLHDYFAHFVGPWGEEVRTRLAQSPVVADADAIAEHFAAVQTGMVAGLMTRTLLEELHVRRSEGLLTGATPQERYADFRRWTNSAPGDRALRAKYPHLFRTVDEQLAAAARYLLHVVQETEHHARQLVATIPGLPTDMRIASVELGEGDTHNGGKSVALITFTDGSRLLYKPHSVDAELGFHTFVDWVNRRLNTGLRTVAVLPTDDAGFVEFVPTEPNSAGEEQYFTKIGSIAGILFLLKAVDIHFENVVSCKDGPVVVDAETLMTPRLRAPASYDDKAASHAASLIIHESVVGTGLLPMVLKARDSDHGVDIGVVGYAPGQPTLYKNLKVRNPGRDDMHVAMGLDETTAPNANLSVDRAVELPVQQQRDLIKAEFRRVLDHARSHPDDVMEAIESALGSAQFRYVNNPTVFYNQLLRMATHPQAMADPVVRAAVLHRVALRTGAAPEILDEEVRQMMSGDVPYFSYVPRSRALFADGRPVAADALAQAPLETVRERVHGLSAEVIARELRLIDFAFVNKLPPTQEPTGFVPGRPLSAPVSHARMLGEAVRIGDELLATLIDGEDPQHPATWIAPQVTTDSQSQWTPGTLGYDLYGGSPGPAMVLAALARRTGRRDFADASRRVLDPIEVQLRGGHLTALGAGVGGMTGTAGTAYAIAVARRLLGRHDDTALCEMAEALVPGPTADTGTDFISGLSGTLAVCLALQRRAGDGTARRRIAESARSVAGALIRELGGPDLEDARVTEFTGYAHGAMGIGPVLIHYGTVCGDLRARLLGQRIVDAVVDAVDGEHDWPRTWGEPERAYGWCHGAPGLLLGALTAVRHAPSCVSAETLRRLAELTLARGFGNNPTYCHGDPASLEILREAQEVVPGSTAVAGDDLYSRLFTEVIEGYELRVDTKYAHSNSLMVGRSGLAWSVLRHLDPDLHPSVLRFQ